MASAGGFIISVVIILIGGFLLYSGIKNEPLLSGLAGQVTGI